MGAVLAGVTDPKQHTAIELNPQAARTLRRAGNLRFAGMKMEEQTPPNVLEHDANVILCAIALKDGRLEELDCGQEVLDAASQIPEETMAKIPSISIIRKIFGGPPCCGFSSMNGNKKSKKSDGDRSLIDTTLSLVELSVPQFVCVENVTGFKHYDGTSAFRLTVRTLVELNYQVSFAFLNAASYGLPQSRTRAFIWAALPGSPLPKWPKRTHEMTRDGHVVEPQALILQRPGSKWGGVHFTPPAIDDMEKMFTVQDAVPDIPQNVVAQVYCTGGGLYPSMQRS